MDLNNVMSSLVFTSKNNFSLKFCYNNILCHGRMFIFYFLKEHLFCLSHCEIRLTMSMDEVGLQNLWWDLELHDHFDIFFHWCVPKWCRDEFNNQSQILQGMGRLHGPWCKQPFSMRWLVYPNHVHSHLSHTFWRLYDCFSHYQSEKSSSSP